MKDENKLVAKNTVFLYVRIAIVMIVSLYSSRVLLKALGVEDFGTYNVVGSVVMMFTSIKGLFVSSTQRFLNYEMGRRDLVNLTNVFSTSIQIHLVICLVFLLVVEPVGLWFINYKMSIPGNNLMVTNILFQLSVISSIMTILATPYDAALIATQKMGIYAYISIFDVILRLGAAASLLQLYDQKLLIYGIEILLITILYRSIAIFYCKRFEFCKFKREIHKDILKDMGGFAGWNFLGNMTFSLSNEGQNLILNVFFGPAVNAARAIAYQARNAFYQLTTNMALAFKPRLTHLYAQGDKRDFSEIAVNSFRFSFFFVSIFVFPLYYYVDDVLALWLHTVPLYSAEIVRCILIMVLLRPIAIANDEVILATGKLKRYQITTSIITTISFLLSFAYLYIHRIVVAPFIIYNIFAVVNIVAVVYIVVRMQVLDSKLYLSNIAKTLFLIPLVIIPVTCIVNRYLLEKTSIHFIIKYIILFVITTSIVFTIGLKKFERVMIFNAIKNYL